MERKWLQDIHKKPKLRRYVTYKQTLKTSEYVKGFLCKTKRSLLSQLVIGILPLHLETGRHKRIKDSSTGCTRNLRPEERICSKCNFKETEDELHFIFICPLYSQFRQQLFDVCLLKDQNYALLSNEDKYIFMLNCCNTALAVYINDSWSERKKHIFNKV